MNTSDFFRTLTKEEKEELDRNNEEFFRLARKPDKSAQEYERMKELSARNNAITAWKGVSDGH
ncbi:MAG: hypothetical protein M0P14_02620 [Alkaliphilus sp.]|nr:hypothetical protein [Alkaliphilus sp.]